MKPRPFLLILMGAAVLIVLAQCASKHCERDVPFFLLGTKAQCPRE